MKIDHKSETKTIHPETLKEISLKAALALLEVARDLRSGAIPQELFDMKSYTDRYPCGTSHCIAGWAICKLEGRFSTSKYHTHFPKGMRNGLFAGYHPSDSIEAADAIERYIYDHAANPWARR